MLRRSRSTNQGNIVGGFNKDFQSFLFLQFKSAAAGRSWIAEISDESNDLSVANSTSPMF